jgi:hypothetical protein
LEAHVERAIEQSGNENLVGVRVMSSNQLKSEDLSIKTAGSNEVEAPQQFADDWVHHIGNRATIRIPTYGVLVRGIRTSTLNMDKFEEDRADLTGQQTVHPAGNAPTKTAFTITIEFTKPEDANGLRP